MRNLVPAICLITGIAIQSYYSSVQAQNVGMGTLSPQARLHIKGANNVSQLLIDADTIQSNTNPLIRLRKEDGTDLMWIHADHVSNLFIGLNAGRVNNPATGINNTFLGGDAGFSNTTGYENSAGGKSALYSNVSGADNTAFGYTALQDCTTGSFNTAFGSEALNNNSTGNSNTAVGYRSQFNGSGNNNTSVGRVTLLFNASGNYNTAVGDAALRVNSTGQENTAVGGQAMEDNTEGSSNTAIGYRAIQRNIGGDYNTATGFNALSQNTYGAGNMANGYEALRNNTTGIQNTAVGNESLRNTPASTGNTAVGFLAGNMFNNGNYNTFVGTFADATAISYTNSTCVGGYTSITSSNQVRIGSGVTSIGGPQNWTNTSDGRIKLNLRADVPGLSFINLLKPVTYTKSLALENEITGRTTDQALTTDNAYEKTRYSGFIAQEVEHAAQMIGYDFSGVDLPQNEKSLYGLRYAEFVVPLVKAVQELSAENMELKRRIEKLEELMKANTKE
ncbi:MAG: hypothetical protein ACHQFX_21255 [Chitinophagales bacterium]